MSPGKPQNVNFHFICDQQQTDTRGIDAFLHINKLKILFHHAFKRLVDSANKRPGEQVIFWDRE